ncbi:MbtH protein [Duganella sp. CF517]|nr:MbtH protein [Duganella sp. CF517]
MPAQEPAPREVAFIHSTRMRMTTSCFDRENETFIVLINHEEQYSIWPHWKAVPGGWKAVDGVKGDKQTVLDYVERAWTDMRPLSLRQWMAQQGQGGEANAGAAVQ